MRKKGLPEILVKTVMSLYEGAKTKVRVGSGLSEEFSVKVGVHQGSVLSPLLFAMVIDEVMENERKGWMKKILLCRRFGPNGGNYGRIEREFLMNGERRWKAKR